MALIGQGGKELIDKISMGPVDLRPVKPYISAVEGGGGELFNHRSDLLPGDPAAGPLNRRSDRFAFQFVSCQS
jgi:hypothetical protein